MGLYEYDMDPTSSSFGARRAPRAVFVELSTCSGTASIKFLYAQKFVGFLAAPKFCPLAFSTGRASQIAVYSRPTYSDFSMI